MAGRYHFSHDIVFNETVPGHLSPNRGLPLNLSLISPPSQLTQTPSSPDPLTGIPHSTPTILLSPSISDVVHARNLISRVTQSTTNSLPKPSRHYNYIDFVNLLISLNNIYDITPPPSPNTSPTHTSLFHDCFLSAPPPFLHRCSWDLTKPPNSYHEATLRSDSSVWYSPMQRELDSLEERKAFE